MPSRKIIYQREYYRKHRLRFLKERRAYYRSHRKEICDYQSFYNATHRAQCTKVRREWRHRNKAKVRKHYLTQKHRYPLKHRARAILKKAIERGKLKRGKCEICSTVNDVHGHHPDYSQPLSVQWLCRTHHAMIHNSFSL
jgi:hypothetical protein